VKKIYTDHPQAQRPHRIHGAVAAAAWQYQVAMDKGSYAEYNAITSEDIKTRCANANRLWPMILKSLDLSKEAYGQSPEMHWWLPESDEDEEGAEQEEEAEEVVEEEEEETKGALKCILFLCRITVLCRASASPHFQAEDQGESPYAARQRHWSRPQHVSEDAWHPGFDIVGRGGY